MDTTQYNRLVSFIWNIADDVLRGVKVRGKFRDVILPMTVLRRLDALLTPTHEAVLQQKRELDAIGLNRDPCFGQNTVTRLLPLVSRACGPRSSSRDNATPVC
jgi:type I restriction enzyme M protein